MVGALEETGAIGEVADAVKDLTGGDRTAELIGDRSGSAALGSAVVDNIPFTTAMIPVVERASAPGGRRRRLLVGALARGLLRRQRDDHRRRRPTSPPRG